MLASDRIPDFGSFVKRACANLVSVGHVEGHAVYCIFMSFEGVDKIAGIGIPQLAGSIIAASDKLVAIFIEAAVCERQYVAF